MDLSAEHLTKNLPLGDGVKVLAVHPSGLVALEKPIDVLSHPNRKADNRRSLLKAHFDFEKECFYDLRDGCDYEEVYLLHRLDSATSGVILVALNEKVARAVKDQFERQRVEKTYIAIIRGRPQDVAGIWTDKFEKRHSSKGAMRMQVGGGQIAKTRVQFIKMDSNKMGLSLVQLIPHTGRTHQLRVQCGQRGHPIIGDRTYGDFKTNRQLAKVTKYKRMFLHAQRLELKFVHNGKSVTFRVQTEEPEAFSGLLAFDRERLSLSVPRMVQRPIVKKIALRRPPAAKGARPPMKPPAKKRRPR